MRQLKYILRNCKRSWKFFRPIFFVIFGFGKKRFITNQFKANVFFNNVNAGIQFTNKQDIAIEA